MEKVIKKASVSFSENGKGNHVPEKRLEILKTYKILLMMQKKVKAGNY